METNEPWARTAVLDHGYALFVEAWGADSAIIEAARMSTGKGFLGWGPGYVCPKCKALMGTERDEQGTDYFCPTHGRQNEARYDTGPGDEKLLKYLWENKHATPFEMAGMTIEIQAPIMVFREWHRHRTQSYNEMSARYIPLPDVNYIPTADRCLMVQGTNRQAGAVGGADVLTHESVLEWLEELSDVYVHAQRVYDSGLRRGIPKELARLPVPVGRYSRMRASANLRNWLAFLTLRSSLKNEKAQWEIRQFADAVGTFVEQAFPRTWSLFVGGAS